MMTRIAVGADHEGTPLNETAIAELRRAIVQGGRYGTPVL
jgi:ribose 5-phosphate isomerase RpiB